MSHARLAALRKYGFEFLTIFIGVFAAFALTDWSENRKDSHAEAKILTEIRNGLRQDTVDLHLNMTGHQQGIVAANYFTRLVSGEALPTDSLNQHYFNLLRTFFSLQNVSGYESLKSKGLETIQNDSLRKKIISLYENNYTALRKLEEEYEEVQFFKTYNHDFNTILAPHFQFLPNGQTTISYPLKLTPREKNILLLHLWRIRVNRLFVLSYYEEIQAKIERVAADIEKETGG